MDTTPSATTTSIYDAIGGEAAVEAAVNEFYVRVLADPDLAGYFAVTDMRRLKGHQRAFITAALGGPQGYEGRPMADAHAGRGITPGAFDAVVGHLGATLASLGVPPDTIGVIAESLLPLKAQIVTA
jgi:hemoglobin